MMFSRCYIGKKHFTQLSLHIIQQNSNANIQFRVRSIHNIVRQNWKNSQTHLALTRIINLPSTRRSVSTSSDNVTQSFANATATTGINLEKVQPLSQIATELPVIPDAPAVPVAVTDTVQSATENIQQLAANSEPTFASIGLGGWSPVGIIENCFEYVHITFDIPWWGTIMIGTMIVRLLMFPLVVLSQRNAAKMNNNMPQMQVIQMKMTEARQTGNAIESARYAQEMMLFMKEKNMNPLRTMLVPLAQAPVFISFFMSLREMANTPVESLTTGGYLWFVDLTMPDQYFMLPLITSVTLYLTIELGTDTARLNSQNMHVMKYVLRALPIVIFPMIMNFPSAVLCYWMSSNFISLVQVGFLKIPRVREFCKIEKLISHEPDSLPVKPKKFIEGFKDSWTNMKITRELQERERIDDIQFQRAGREALIKTYKYDPTKVRPTTSAASRLQSATIEAKKR